MKFISALFANLLKFSVPEFVVHTDVALDYFEAVDFCESTGDKLALFDDEADFQNVSDRN